MVRGALVVAPRGEIRFQSEVAVRCLKKFFGPRPDRLLLPAPLALWAQTRPEIPFCVVKEDRVLFVTCVDRSRKAATFFLLEEQTNWEKRLTPREAAVIIWAARGKTNQDIAEIMGLKEATVKTYTYEICQKLGVENRTAAASYATAESFSTPPTAAETRSRLCLS